MVSRSVLMATAALFLVLSLSMTQAYASCTVHKYYPTRGYDFANGNTIFHYLDMDPSMPDIQDAAVLSPGQNGLAEVRWSWGSQCQDCDVSVGVFGSWSEGELARLFEGIKGQRPGAYVVPIPYKAPSSPGLYRLRVIFSYGAQATDFNATNLCAETQCEGGECNLLIADGLVNVTPTSTEDSIPPAVKIIRPKGASVGGVVMSYIGEEIFIEALVDDPYVAVSVLIEGKKVAGELPFGLNTTSMGEGLYRVTVTAVDKAQNQGQDEVFIQLISRSRVAGRQPLELWSTQTQGRVTGTELSGDGRRLAIAEEPNTLHLLNGNGADYWSFSAPGSITALSMSGDGELLAFSTANNVYVLRKDGSVAWNYTTPEWVNAVSISGDGRIIGLATGTVVYALEDGSLAWNFTVPRGVNAMALSESGGTTVLAMGSDLYSLGKFGLLEWNYTAPEGINSISMSRDSSLIAVAAGSSVYTLTGRDGSMAWNYTAPAVVTAVALSGNGELLALATGGYTALLDATGEPLSSFWVGEVSSIRLSSSGEYIASSSGSGVRYFHNPAETPLVYELVLLAILLVGLAIWKTKGLLLPRREVVLQEPKGPEAPAPELPPVVEEKPKKKPKVEPEVKSLATGELRLRVTSAVSGGAISGATVTIDGDRGRTDAKGAVLFERFPLKAYRVTVASPLFEPQGQEYTLKEGSELLEIKLAPVAKLTPEQQERLHEAVSSLRTRFEQFATFDTTIPCYYQRVGDRLTDVVLGLSGRPEYFLEAPERYSLFMEELVGMVETVCKGLSEIMVDWKNIMLYKATTDLTPACCMLKPPIELGEDIPPFIRDPEAYTRRNFRVVQERLANVDSLITTELERLTILPISSLWKVSDGLLSKAREERGARKAVLVIAADMVLDYVQDMLKRPEILERLKRGII